MIPPPDHAQRRLVVVIPALNEAATIADVIRTIPQSMPGVGRIHALVIDDGSTDETIVRARAAGADTVSHGENRGLGVTFRTGIHEALKRDADILVFIDGDGQFQSADIATLIVPITNGRADIATCTRFADPARIPDMPRKKIWGNRVVRDIVNRATGKSFTDVSCGFRAYTRDAALRLTLSSRFTYTNEVILDAVRKGLRIAEVPLTVRGEREFGTSRVARNVFVYGIQWLAIFLRTLRDYSPFQVFGLLAGVLAILGFGSGLFVGIHWFATGQTYPYRSLVILSGVLILLSAFVFAIALLADMLRRQRELLDETLYLVRKMSYDSSIGYSARERGVSDTTQSRPERDHRETTVPKSKVDSSVDTNAHERTSAPSAQ